MVIRSFHLANTRSALLWSSSTKNSSLSFFVNSKPGPTVTGASSPRMSLPERTRVNFVKLRKFEGRSISIS